MEEGANPGGKLIDVSPPFSNGIKDLRRQTNRFYNLYSFIEAFAAAIPSYPASDKWFVCDSEAYTRSRAVIKFRAEFIYRFAAFKSASVRPDVFSLSVLAGYISPRAEPRVP